VRQSSSDGDELDGADGVAGQDGAGQLRVGAERLGDRDRAGLEGELGGPVGQEAGSQEQRGDRDVPAALGRKARTASPVAGGRPRRTPP
jgi:hypothetical protein